MSGPPPGVYKIVPAGAGSNNSIEVTASNNQNGLGLTLMYDSNPTEPNYDRFAVVYNKAGKNVVNIICTHNGTFVINQGITETPIPVVTTLPTDPSWSPGACWQLVDTGDGDNSFYINGYTIPGQTPLQHGQYQWNVMGASLNPGATVQSFPGYVNVEWSKWKFIPAQEE